MENALFSLFFYFLLKGEINIEEKFYKVWLSLIEGLGIKRYENLIKVFKTNKAIFNASKKELLAVNMINEKICEDILDKEKM